MDGWKGGYASNITFSTTNSDAASLFSWLSGVYMCPSWGHTTYTDSSFSSIKYKLTKNSCNSAATHTVPYILRSADSQCCNISMTCSHLKCSTIHPYLLLLQELYTGAYGCIQVLSTPFGQHQGLVSVTRFLPMCQVEVFPVVFYVHLG